MKKFRGEDEVLGEFALFVKKSKLVFPLKNSGNVILFFKENKMELVARLSCSRGGVEQFVKTHQLKRKK